MLIKYVFSSANVAKNVLLDRLCFSQYDENFHSKLILKVFFQRLIGEFPFLASPNVSTPVLHLTHEP